MKQQNKDMEGGKLTNNQIVRLARAISSNDMESIGLGYLGIEEETIRNLKAEHRENIEAFNRSLIRNWTNRNAGPDQAQVYKLCLLSSALVHCEDRVIPL